MVERCSRTVQIDCVEEHRKASVVESWWLQLEALYGL